MYPDIKKNISDIDNWLSKDRYQEVKHFILSNENLVSEIRKDMLNTFYAIGKNDEAYINITHSQDALPNVKRIMDAVLIYYFFSIKFAQEYDAEYKKLFLAGEDKNRKNRMWIELKYLIQVIFPFLTGGEYDIYLDKFEMIGFEKDQLKELTGIETSRGKLDFITIGQFGTVRATKEKVLNCVAIALNHDYPENAKIDANEFDKLIQEYDPQKGRDFFVEAPTNSKYTQKIAKTLHNIVFGLYYNAIKYAKIAVKDLGPQAIRAGVTIVYDNVCKINNNITPITMAEMAYEPIATKDKYNGVRNFMSSINLAEDIVRVTT